MEKITAELVPVNTEGTSEVEKRIKETGPDLIETGNHFAYLQKILVETAQMLKALMSENQNGLNKTVETKNRVVAQFVARETAFEKNGEVLATSNQEMVKFLDELSKILAGMTLSAQAGIEGATAKVIETTEPEKRMAVPEASATEAKTVDVSAEKVETNITVPVEADIQGAVIVKPTRGVRKSIAGMVFPAKA